MAGSCLIIKRFFVGVLLVTFLLNVPIPTTARQVPAPTDAQNSTAQPNQSSVATGIPYTLYVTVMNKDGHVMKGLKRDAFDIFDGKRQAEVVSFSAEDAPASIGILLDTSGSMFSRESSRRNKAARIEFVRDALASLLAGSNPANEYFFVAFNQSPQLLLERSTDPAAVLAVLDKLAATKLKGLTALYDALYLAADTVSRGRHRKRAIILVTDGQDTISRYSFNELKRALAESDITVYIIGLPGPDSYLVSDWRMIIEEIAKISGGTFYFPRNEQQLRATADFIAVELRNRYAISFMPAEDRDGWHEVRVKVKELADQQGKKVKLLARTRKGFYNASSRR